MHHNSSAFSGPLLEEWLIYFERTYKTFTIRIIGDGTDYKVAGVHTYSRNVAISLKFEVLGKTVVLDLGTDNAALRKRGFRGNAPLVGTILVAGEPSGFCFVENSHEEGKPVIRIERKFPPYRLDAYRAVPGFVICPLLVFGVENWEMVLERYEMLDKSRKRTLPENGLRRNFVGSCRSIRFFQDPIERAMEGISVVVAVSELIVKDFFMSTL